MSSPYQVTDSYEELNTKLSLVLTFGLLLAAAAAVPGLGTLEIVLSTVPRLLASVCGSDALK